MKIIKIKITIFFILAAIFVFLPCFVFASSTDGTIDSTDKYAQNESIGLINFGVDNGDVHVTDSGLSGYCWSANYGWISLNSVTNDGEGNLSGLAWGENIGWINFSPDNGGVTIDSDGEFSGTAWGSSIGWVIFDETYKVKTDWRPQSVRPVCNNALDDDSDGFIDYPSDLGCESLTDDNEVNPGGLPPTVYNPPTPPAPTPETPRGFNILINNGDEYTNKKDVELKLYGGSDTKQFAISQNSDFKDTNLQAYNPNNSGFQVLNFQIPNSVRQLADQITNYNFQIYAKFYTQYGQPSDIVSDSIILDTVPPETPNIIYPINDSVIKTDKPLFKGEAEQDSKIFLELTSGLVELIKVDIIPNKKGQWSFLTPQPLADGHYQLKVYVKDLAGNISGTTLSDFTILTFVFPVEPIEPIEPAEPVEPTEPIEPTEPTEPIESVTPPVEPVEPIEPVEPTEPIEPIEPVEPVKPIEPIEPIEPVEPAKPIEPVTSSVEPTEPTKKISLQQEVKKFFNKVSSLIQSGIKTGGSLVKSGIQSGGSLINNISQKTKEGFGFIGGKIKDAGQSVGSLVEQYKPAKEQPKTSSVNEPILKTEQKPAEKVIEPEPVQTIPPENIPPEVVVAKSGYGNIDLSPSKIVLSKGEAKEEKLALKALSNQEINLFVRPDGDVFGVLGQILYNSETARFDQENNKSRNQPASAKATDEVKKINSEVSIFEFLKPSVALAQDGATEPTEIDSGAQQSKNLSEQIGGWKLREFVYADDDNDGVFQAKVSLPVTKSGYTIRTLIAYKDGNVKSIDTPIFVDSHGYVFRNTKEGVIRINQAKVTLFRLNDQTKQYEIFEDSFYKKKNPQITDQDGAYSFLVPAGRYYVTVQARGYGDYESDRFDAQDGLPINFKIELKKSLDWLNMIIWIIGIAGLFMTGLWFGFFMKRRREK